MENTGKFNLHCIHHSFIFAKTDYFITSFRREKENNYF